jgi:hypothetical protein
MLQLFYLSAVSEKIEINVLRQHKKADCPRARHI